MTFVLFKWRMHMKKSLYIYNCGDLKRKDNTLRFTTYDDEKRDVPIERISDIYVMSELSFNTKFINFISQYGIPMHFFNYYLFYTGSLYHHSGFFCIFFNIGGIDILLEVVAVYHNESRRLHNAVTLYQLHIFFRINYHVLFIL